MDNEIRASEVVALTSGAQASAGPIATIGSRSRSALHLSAQTALDRMLADIRSIAPLVAARATEFESARRIPLDLIRTLKSIGIFRMLAPRSHGGFEFDLASANEVTTALARIDGSFGWTAAIGSGAGIFASLLPRDSYDQVYRRGPDVIFAGSIQPAGTAEPHEDGFLVNGRWPFASGCQHADWIVANCVMTKDGEPRPGPADGIPLMRLLFMPTRHWQIEDTWRAGGLKGTGSHHIVLRNAIVPAANFIDLAAAEPCLPGPLYSAPMQLIPLMHGPVALGMAEGAVNDVVEMAQGGRRQLRAPTAMRDSELFQAELGRAEAEVRAARALLEAQTASHWRHAVAGTLRDDALMTEGTQAMVWLTETCLRVAERCFALGGGSAVYDASPLQRRLRDLQVAAQHAAVHQRHYAEAGRLLLARLAEG